jgi:hypothetical protein
VQISSTLNLIGAVLTMALGIIGFLNPMMVGRLVGIVPSAPHGLSELRATYGGLFIGLGGFALSARNPVIDATIGSGWIGAALARAFSMVVDFRAEPLRQKQINKLNLGGIVLEAGIGLLLLIHE